MFRKYSCYASTYYAYVPIFKPKLLSSLPGNSLNIFEGIRNVFYENDRSNYPLFFMYMNNAHSISNPDATIILLYYT